MEQAGHPLIVESLKSHLPTLVRRFTPSEDHMRTKQQAFRRRQRKSQALVLSNFYQRMTSQFRVERLRSAGRVRPTIL